MVNTMLLEVDRLTVSYTGNRSIFTRQNRDTCKKIVDNVSFSIKKGTVTGLVGESGCGKTTLGRALARFIPADSGSVRLDGHELLTMNKKTFRRIRSSVQVIFQNPYASLNPRMTAGDMLLEAVRASRKPHQTETPFQKVNRLFSITGLDSSMRHKFPHEFSGGQRQRLAIARALAVDPDLIIADEPVSSLDVSIAAQIINLFNDLRSSIGLTMLFISHDLSVVNYLSQQVLIMQHGSIVESGDTTTVFTAPVHPYTQNLIRSIPALIKRS